jgi:hypothetical protein
MNPLFKKRLQKKNPPPISPQVRLEDDAKTKQSWTWFNRQLKPSGWVKFTPSDKYCVDRGFIPVQYCDVYQQSLSPVNVEAKPNPLKKRFNSRRFTSFVMKNGERGVHYALGYMELYELIKDYGVVDELGVIQDYVGPALNGERLRVNARQQSQANEGDDNRAVLEAVKWAGKETTTGGNPSPEESSPRSTGERTRSFISSMTTTPDSDNEEAEWDGSMNEEAMPTFIPEAKHPTIMVTSLPTTSKENAVQTIQERVHGTECQLPLANTSDDNRAAVEAMEYARGRKLSTKELSPERATIRKWTSGSDMTSPESNDEAPEWNGSSNEKRMPACSSDNTHHAVTVETEDPVVTGQYLPKISKTNPVRPIQEASTQDVNPNSSSSLSSRSASSSSTVRLEDKAVAALTNRGHSVLPLKKPGSPGEIYYGVSKIVAALPVASPITGLRIAAITTTTRSSKRLREEPSSSPYRPCTMQPAWLWTTTATFEECFQNLLQKDEKFCQFDGVDRGWEGVEI